MIMSSIVEKLLSVAVGLFMVAGIGFAVYAGIEHNAAQKAQIEQLQEDKAREAANTAAALQAVSALGSALDAKAAAQTAAAAHTTGAKTLVASAVAAAPAVASVVVPESYWQAVYGGTDAK